LAGSSWRSRRLHRGIPGYERVVFANSAPQPHVEETERYLQVLDQFLGSAEMQAI
jgi:pimeloyl-ACP methyl ester carboxylesterase